MASQLRLDLFPANYDGSIEVKASFRGGTRLEVIDEVVSEIEDVILEDACFDSVEMSFLFPHFCEPAQQGMQGKYKT